LPRQRRALNEYAGELHQTRTFGKSAYWAISQLIGHDGKKKVALDLGQGTNRKPEEYHQMRKAIRELMEAARITGEPSRHPLKAVRLKDWSYGIDDSILQQIRATEDSAQHLRQIIAHVMPEMGLPVERLSLADLEKAKTRCTALVADSDRMMCQVEEFLGILPDASIGLLPEDPSSIAVTSDDQWPNSKDALGIGWNRPGNVMRISSF
jgi:hypothetical protein